MAYRHGREGRQRLIALHGFPLRANHLDLYPFNYGVLFMRHILFCFARTGSWDWVLRHLQYCMRIMRFTQTHVRNASSPSAKEYNNASGGGFYSCMIITDHPHTNTFDFVNQAEGRREPVCCLQNSLMIYRALVSLAPEYPRLSQHDWLFSSFY
jgi:hypothetical protein